MNVQISGWKWFPLLKGVPPTEPSEARRGARAEARERLDI